MSNLLDNLDPGNVLDAGKSLVESPAFQLGSVKLSILLIAKALFVIGALLWLSQWLARLAEMGLNRLPQLRPSLRVLWAKIIRIILVALAVMIGLNALGIDLTALAIFSGTLGLGIGFGLQKVFSNLISGIILLIDNSIKPGDVIAIGDTYGWVNKIGARYVSLLTRDGKEHLIPNETLITQQVENWSYSNSNVRLHVPISISYDSDVSLAKGLMLQVAKAHRRVLTAPEPMVFVTALGDNGIEFVLFVWINDPVNGELNIKGEILEKIWREFKESGVSVPFPQRDLHLTQLSDEVLQQIAKSQKNH